MAGSVIDGAAEDSRGEIMPDQRFVVNPIENLSPVAFSCGRRTHGVHDKT